MLSLATKEKQLTRDDAKARLELFCIALKDVPGTDLRRGAEKLLKSATFMPTPAELLAAARHFTSRREYAISRAKHLLWKHEREYVPPPADPVQPDELKALISDAAAALKDDPNE